MTRGHFLVVVLDEEYNFTHPDFDPEYRYRIECASPAECGGWIECGEEHPEGSSAGPYEGDEDSPWYDEEEFEFHGVLHEWHSGWGWTVPFKGCVVASAWRDELPDELGPPRVGRWLVDDEWDGDEMWLSVTDPARTREPSAP